MEQPDFTLSSSLSSSFPHLIVFDIIGSRGTTDESVDVIPIRRQSQLGALSYLTIDTKLIKNRLTREGKVSASRPRDITVSSMRLYKE